MAQVYVVLASAVAIAGLVALNVALGGWTPARIASLEEAAARLRDDHIGFSVGDGVLAADGRSALLAEADGTRTGLVIARGSTSLTRLLAPRDVCSAEATVEGDLRLELDDFTLPRATLALKDEATARAWAARLTGRDERAHA